MRTPASLQQAADAIVDGGTLSELKEASRDLRALAPDSALADLVDDKIEAIEHEKRLIAEA